jgi:hypothetical protein
MIFTITSTVPMMTHGWRGYQLTPHNGEEQDDRPQTAEQSHTHHGRF